MTKKQLHIVLASFLMLVIALNIGHSVVESAGAVAQNQVDDTDDQMPEAEFLSVQATVPILSFKLVAVLVFAFEIFKAEPTPDLPCVDRLVGLIDTYRANLFTSAIITNAP